MLYLMPRHNCSNLERFAKNLDRSQVMEDKPTGIGPYIWKLSSKGGVPMHPERRKVRSFQLQHPNNWPQVDCKRVSDQFPIFTIDGEKYAAHRWLYFQMYDDRHIFDGEDLDKYLCSDQPSRTVWMWTHHPRTAYAPVLPIQSDEFRPWNMLFWHDWYAMKKICFPKKADTYAFDLGYPHTVFPNDPAPVSLTKTKRTKLTQYKRVELVFPEYVGPDRIALVHHYLKGGNDRTRPEPSGFEVSAAWKRYAKKNGIPI